MANALTLHAVGDLQLGDSPTSVGYGFFSRYHAASLVPLFGKTASALEGSDILFGNLETTLVPPPPGTSHRGALQMRGRPEFAADLKQVGFTVLNVANNHAVQHGDDTFHQTVAAVRAAGIGACGVRGSDGWSTEPVWLRNGEVVVLGYCLRPRQYEQTPPPYAEGMVHEICADVERANAMGATVIVSLHWGEEFVPTPSEAEISIGHAIIDAGATLILGHHPHVVRPVERYRSGAIVYSMGNFMGDMVWYSPFLRGEIIRCTIEDRSVKELSVIETHLREDYRPTLGTDAPTTALPEGVLRGLDAAEYARAITDSIRRQRRALYRSALLNIRQTPMRVLVQLTSETIRNKIAALVRPSKGSVAHVPDSHQP